MTEAVVGRKKARSVTIKKRRPCPESGYSNSISVYVISGNPTNINLFKANNRNAKEGVKYLQS